MYPTGLAVHDIPTLQNLTTSDKGGVLRLNPAPYVALRLAS